MAATLNFCDVPPWVIGSRQFNRHPQRLQIQGISAADRSLFERLDTLNLPHERAMVFNDYMSVKFHLHEWSKEESDLARRSIKNSYLRFLRGWGVDSNSMEGAVLKGWVESRIGLAPTYHRGPLAATDHDDYTDYAVDRMRGSARTNNILAQLDLLYTYSQYELERSSNGQRWLPLFRGTYDASDHEIIENLGSRSQIVRLNNLSSFTSDREKAWEFGTTVWQADVPICKIFFYGALLPQSILKGENEYLVIGGEYLVRSLLY